MLICPWSTRPGKTEIKPLRPKTLKPVPICQWSKKPLMLGFSWQISSQIYDLSNSVNENLT